MASFKVKLFINGEERNVLNINQSFKQVVDITGRPEGTPYGEPLFLSLESTIDDSFFYQYAFYSTDMIAGELIFYKRDGFSVLHKLEFANAYILGIHEEFDAYSGNPLQFSVKIGWGIIRLNGVIFEEAWNPFNPYEEQVEATVIEDNEPQITEFLITDKDGNPKPKYNIGEFIYLRIKSVNKIGDAIDIRLNKKSKDFKYKGTVLPDDTLSDYVIQTDNDVIKLEVVKPLRNQNQNQN